MDKTRLLELAGVYNQSEILNELAILEKIYQGKHNLNIDTDNESISSIQRRMDAATRALGLANRLTSVEEKKKHLSRVLSNMNTIRAALVYALNQLSAGHAPNVNNYET